MNSQPPALSRPLVAIAAGIASIALALCVQYAVILPTVEERLCDRVVTHLEAMNYHNLTVTCSGRDISLSGPIKAGDIPELTRRINQISGVRTLHTIVNTSRDALEPTPAGY